MKSTCLSTSGFPLDSLFHQIAPRYRVLLDYRCITYHVSPAGLVDLDVALVVPRLATIKNL